MEFRPIQVVLILGILFSLLLYFRNYSTKTLDRMIAVVLVAVCIVAVVLPDSVTIVANLLGVVRGTDLTFYLFAVATVFVGMTFFVRMKEMERRFTRLVRYMAIRDAKEMGTRGHDTP